LNDETMATDVKRPAEHIQEFEGVIIFERPTRASRGQQIHKTLIFFHSH
jgi:hypothetical protein